MATGDNYPVLMGFDKAAPGGVATLDSVGNVPFAQLGNVSGENLLINAYFADRDSIIDQRNGYVLVKGATYYTNTGLNENPVTVDEYNTVYDVTVGTDYTSFKLSAASDAVTYYAAPADVVRGYVAAAAQSATVDRWMLWSKGTVALITDKGITFDTNGVNGWFFAQRVGDPGRLSNQKVTLSVLFDDEEMTDGSVYLTLVQKGENPQTSHTGYAVKRGVASITVQLGAGLTSIVAVINTKGASTFTVKAAKLELGSTQTLAHQDADGNWVLNDPPPDKALELAKCQRYFYDKVPAFFTFSSSNENRQTWNVHCQFPTTMRATPSIPKVAMVLNVFGKSGAKTITPGERGISKDGVRYMHIPIADATSLDTTETYYGEFKNISAEL